MRRVVIESPYAGNIERNVAYARAALLHSLSRGEAPLASHLLYTQDGVLDDLDPAQRKMGIEAGHTWIPVAEAVIFYIDLGMSRGMWAGYRAAQASGKEIEFRRLGHFWESGT